MHGSRDCRAAAGTGVPPYDVTWMRRDLGVDEER
jgi:hypothetical protein